MPDEQSLTWTVEAIGADGPPLPDGPLPATVPGGVHPDLIAAGLLDDLAVRGRDDAQEWVSRATWRYRTTLRRPDRPVTRALLVLEGVATLGRVAVAGRERLATQNMFRTYVLDVTADLAAAPEVEVTVDLDPVLPLAEARDEADPLPRPGAYRRPYNQVRTMACSFGWDWGPATMGAGLYRPVRLLTWDGARLGDVRVTPRAADGHRPAAVTVDAAVEDLPTGAAPTVRLVVRDAAAPSGPALAAASVPVTAGRARVTVEVPGAAAWWPHTEGARPLYDVTVLLEPPVPDGGPPAPLDRHDVRVGFRTVEVVQRPDAAGTGFALHVNGRRVWVRGVDWIPDDPFPGRVTPERYRARLAEAVAAGANTVRVWGGGLYEDDAFYDACDELGLLVIQDFAFACAAYPEDDATVAEVRAEVRDNVRRLRHRASLALWCGNNENLWGHADWGWAEELGDRPWGLGYYTAILPELVAELDGTRPYVPGSPFSPDGPDGPLHPNDPGHGMSHIWDVWNQRDYLDYERWHPRFVSEFGYQAPASWPTLVTALGHAPDPADPALAHHQRADDGMAKLAAGLRRHLPHPPASGVAWYVATQLLQARAVTVGVGHLRSLHDHCSGAIWWQLNDIWPAVSWSVLDVHGRRKPAWYALRQAFDTRLVTVAAGDAGPRVVLVNDTGEVWADRLVVRLADAAGSATVLERDVEVPPHGSLALGVDVVRPGAAVLLADVGHRRATRWLGPDPDLELAPQDVTVTAAAATGPGGEQRIVVTVTAGTLLRDVCLLAELALPDARTDGVAGGQLATLLPGESAVLLVRLPAGGATGAEGARHLAEGIDWGGLVWSDNRLRHPLAGDDTAAPATHAIIKQTSNTP